MTDRHPIQVVARRTGLSPHVIRAWERRYHAVEPQRTATNRRVFTREDIERLIRLRRVVRAGHRIGDVAALPNEQLDHLIRSSGLSEPAAPSRASRVPPPLDTSELLEAAVAAVDALDAEALDAIFTRAGILLSRPAILERLVLPLMKYVGDGWREGRLRVAHEHLATSCTRSFLGHIERTYPSELSAPAIVVATPAGQVHELGALAAAATAASEGYRVTYLGASLPAEDILAACELRGCRAVALSITYPADDPTLPAELRRLGKSLEGGVRVIVGGQSARSYGEPLEEIGAMVVDDLGAMRQVLERLRVAPGEVGS